MIFSVIIILLVAGVAYFHYAQGFFSATISATIAVLSAALAVGYHEVIVYGLLKGKMADYAHAFVLVGVFALSYIILRTLFDKMVPGNIRLPVIADRVGGGVMGLIAGIFTAGIFALAAESLPFGPAVGGYTRYPVDTHDGQIMLVGKQRNADIPVNDSLKEDTFDPTKRSGLLLFPADDALVGLIEKLSNGGSLSGDIPLSAVHPNYPDELFAQRLGVQTGAKRSALNVEGVGKHAWVEDPGVFKPDVDLTKRQADAEISTVRERAIVFKPEPPNTTPLVIRVMFDNNAADEDKLVRVSPGSVRLVAKGENFFPVGTMEGTNAMYVNRPDDFMFVNTKEKNRGADFVFYVDADKVFTGDPKQPKIADGVFIEVKRLARIDLSDKPVINGVKPPKEKDEIDVLRKPALKKPGGSSADKESASGSAAAAPAAPSSPFVMSQFTETAKLFTAINTGTANADIANQQIASGTLSLQGKKFVKLDINTTETIQRLSKGEFAIDDLFEPPGKKLVQVIGAPPAEGGDAWAWANNLSKFVLGDAIGNTYTLAGAWAKVKQEQQDKLVAQYDATGSGKQPQISAGDGRPTDVWLAFLVPVGTDLKVLSYDGKKVADVMLKVQ